METNTIKEIKKYNAEIISSLESYKKYHKEQGSDMKTAKYGSESEYSINGIILGIHNLSSDITFLVNAHNLFIKVSTYDERCNIKESLYYLNIYINNIDNNSIVTKLEGLKKQLRFYNIRLDKNRLADFSEEIDNLRRTALGLQSEIEIVKEKTKTSTEINEEIIENQNNTKNILNEIQDKKNHFIEELNSFVDAFSDFKELAEKAKQNETNISELLNEVNDEKDIFDEFVNKISEREQVLQNQSEKTISYEKKLEEYKEEQTSTMNDALKLIEEAKKALNYKNAEGLSAAFSSRLESVSCRSNTLGWLISSGTFIILTLAIGIWIVTGWGLDNNLNQNQMVLNLVGRLSMIPFTIIAAVFCANQYTKQKNIIEDYAYKTTIAKSIVAFSEELRDKDPEKYTEYISTILKEIHQDPLRKRDKNNENYSLNKETTGLIEKLIVLLQSTITKS